jgi:hypothetical protein
MMPSRGVKEMGMRRKNKIRTGLILAAILCLPVLALVAQQTTSLTIDGLQGQAKVIQMQGRNYVEVDGLARISGGAIRFVGNQIVLTLPSVGDASSQAAQPTPTAAAGFSKEFLSAGIEAMTEVREWHAALKNAIERGYPLSAEWLGTFKRQAQTSLRQAEVAASTDMDQKAFPLLQNEFNNMSALSDKYLKMAKDMNYIAPNALENDPLEQKLLTCGRSLAAMVSTNQFVDDRACQ